MRQKIARIGAARSWSVRCGPHSGERGTLRSLQQSTQIYFDVARVGAECFLGRSAGEPGGAQIPQQLFTQAGDKTLEPAADGGFVNGEGPRDLKQRLAVEIIGDQQETVFGIYIFQSAADGFSKDRCFRG